MSPLRAHVLELHPRLSRQPLPRKNSDLAVAHAHEHHQFGSYGHRHAGPNTGPDVRPEGWFTGQDVVITEARPVI